MKKLSALLSITLLFALIGCSTAGPQEVNKPANPTISADKLVDNVRKQIAEYDKPIADAKAKLEALPEWKEYLAQREVFNEAAKVFKEADKKAANLQEFKVLQYLQNRQMELKKLLEVGK